MTVINPFSIAVNKALKISNRSLHSSTSCHLLDFHLLSSHCIGSKLFEVAAQNKFTHDDEGLPCQPDDFCKKKTLGGDWPFCYNSLECPFGKHFYYILS